MKMGGTGGVESKHGDASTGESSRVAALVLDEHDCIVEVSKDMPALLQTTAEVLHQRNIRTLFEGRDGKHFVTAWIAAVDGLARSNRPFAFGFTRRDGAGASNLKVEVNALTIGERSHKLVVITDVGTGLNPGVRDRDKSYLAGRSDVAMTVLHHLNNAMTSLSVSASLARERISEIDVSRFARLNRWLDEQGGGANFGGATEDPDARNSETVDGQGASGQFRTYLKLLGGEMSERVARCRAEIEHVQEGLKRLENLTLHLRQELEVTAEQEMTDAASIVLDTVGPLHARARQQGIYLVVAKSPNVGLVTDRHRVVQVLRQLVLNALDACAARGPEVARDASVELAWLIDDAVGSVAFTVIDTGEGFDASKLARLWEPGFSTWNRSGHGLHDAANMVSWLGGRMTADSDGIGRGARFTVALPLISA